MPESLLPDVGEGLTEAEIVEWKVKVGDVVAVNDIVVDIETAKSVVELPSPYAGTVLALLVPAGETVAVGTPIIRIGDPSEAAAPAPAADGGPETGTTRAQHEVIDTNVPPEGNPTLVGYGPREVVAQRRARKGQAAPRAAVATAHQDVQDLYTPGVGHQEPVVEVDEPAVPAVEAPAVAEAEAPVGERAAAPADVRALAKPPVRKLAKDLGVDLASLTATGPHGTVSRADVEAAARSAAGPAGSAVEAAGTAPRERREPVKGVRKMMSQAMVRSAFTSPHVTEWVSVDVTRTMEFVDRLKERREFRDVRVSPLLVLARAVLLACRRTPVVNSSYDDEAGEVVYKSYVNLGIAAATPRGLVVPNIKDAQALGLRELAGALGELTRTAREGRTQPADMAGGTFTITNVGVFGIDGGTPIINPGESAILCFGAVRKQPWVVSGSGGDQVAIRQVTTLALSFDHRHIDGEKGSQFLADVAGILEDPASALLF